MATALPFDPAWWLQLSEAADSEADLAPLIRAARAGDLEAFDRLMQLEQHRVYRTALNLLNRREDAEDAVQETFLRVHRGLGRYDAARPWSAWLYAVTLNVCRDLARKRRRRAWVSLEAWRESGGEDPATAEPAPDEEAESAGRRAMLQDGLRRLSPREREALTLHAIEDVPVAETAAILGVAEGTVRSLTSRARAKLADYVQARLEGNR